MGPDGLLSISEKVQHPVSEESAESECQNNDVESEC